MLLVDDICDGRGGRILHGINWRSCAGPVDFFLRHRRSLREGGWRRFGFRFGGGRRRDGWCRGMVRACIFEDFDVVRGGKAVIGVDTDQGPVRVGGIIHDQVCIFGEGDLLVRLACIIVERFGRVYWLSLRVRQKLR